MKKMFFNDLAVLAAGSFLYALSLSQCLTPHTIVTGGASGIAVALYALSSFPVGFAVFLINFPLFLCSWHTEGWRHTIRTVVCVLFSSFCTDLCSRFPPFSTDVFLSAIVGGTLMGCAAGLLLSRGFTTGGSDLAARLIHRRFPQFSIGRIVALLDSCIVSGSALILHRMDGFLYSITSIFTCSMVLDHFLQGAGRARLTIIVSTVSDSICRRIEVELHRSATILHGHGSYTGQSCCILLCVTKRGEEYALQQIVRDCDTAAFCVVTDAAHVQGNGFSGLSETVR